MIGSLIDGAEITRPSRTIAKNSPTCAVVYSAKSLAPVSARRNATTRRPCWSLLTFAAVTWSPEKSAVAAVGSGWPAVATRGPWELDGAVLGDGQRDEVEPAGLADEAANRLGVADARDLDDDPVRPGGEDHRLRDAGRVHAPLDDLLDDVDVRLAGRLAPGGNDAVLDLQAALEVEAQLRLDLAGLAVRRQRRQVQVRPEVERERQDANDGNEERSGSTHERG